MTLDEYLFLKKHGIKIDIKEINYIKLIPNRIISILSEKNISPLLNKNDIKKMNLRDEQHWFNILRGKEELQVFGENGCLFQVAKWLDVELCDIYGMCFKKANGNKYADCGNCKSKGRWI